ncbi:MAG: ribosome maturation factor RimP [Endomicrobia bacterium]|nr:ribosome maturation factor RimP [Endomicrobiia bacterium]MCL2506693.1 ribosome maturation factor RimP [Endomicrobiia bacterium]
MADTQSKIKEIENILSPVAENENMELVDVQYLKEAGDWVLRIFIDKENGVNMDDCAQASRAFEASLDESDILKDSYVLEVSSPGIDRVLKTEKDFKRFAGSKIKVRTFNPINNQKNFLGEICSCNDGKVIINDVTKGEVEIEITEIKKANLEADI